MLLLIRCFFYERQEENHSCAASSSAHAPSHELNPSLATSAKHATMEVPGPTFPPSSLPQRQRGRHLHPLHFAASTLCMILAMTIAQPNICCPQSLPFTPQSSSAGEWVEASFPGGYCSFTAAIAVLPSSACTSIQQQQQQSRVVLFRKRNPK